MKTVIRKYLQKFDELNVLYEDTVNFTKNAKKARDDFFDILIDAYIEGFNGAAYILSESVEKDEEKIMQAVDKKYDGESIFRKFEKYYGKADSEALKNLMESEFHRTYNTGAADCASAAKGEVFKKWTATVDEKTRDSHFFLNGTTIPLNEKFYSVSGDSAYFPGGFATAEENANCRCILQYTRQGSR